MPDDERNSRKVHAATIRQRIESLISDAPMSARELSRRLRIREKEIYDHLPHIARSVRPKNRKLIILPFCCVDCGFEFIGRKHFTRPGKCPRCRQTRIEDPLFHIQ